SCGSRNQSNPIVKFHCQTGLDAIYSNRIYSSPSRSNASLDGTIPLVGALYAPGLVAKRESRQKLMKGVLLALWFFVLFPPSLPAQTQKPLLLGLASISGGIETLYVTKKIGAFKRNGLDVDFLLLQGGSQALQVLLSGEIKLISGGGGTAAQRARF